MKFPAELRNLRTKYIVITRPAGQLGNRLIQFANFIAFAKENNKILFNPGFEKYASYFNYTDQQIWCKYPYQVKEKYQSKSHFLRHIIIQLIKFLVKYPFVHRVFYTDNTIYKRIGVLPTRLITYLLLGTKDRCNLDDHDNILLKNGQDSRILFFGGWKFRAYDSFDKYAHEIRTIFKPKDQYLKNVNKLISRIKNEVEVLIGIHIRHSDYKTHREGKFFYDLKTYKQKMKEVAKLFPNKKTGFLICTDGKAGAKDFLDFNNIYFGNNHIIEDMYAFAACDYIVGPPSTYTGWASFYGNVPLFHIKKSDSSLSLDKFVIFNQKQFLKLDESFAS